MLLVLQSHLVPLLLQALILACKLSQSLLQSLLFLLEEKLALFEIIFYEIVAELRPQEVIGKMSVAALLRRWPLLP